MNEYSIIGIVVALIGVLKGKDIWDFLKAWIESKDKKNDKVILFYEEQLEYYKKREKELEQKNEELVNRLEKHILKSRSKK